MPTANTPFYADWTFWAFVSSALAIALSQLPPVRQWFNPGKLAMELTDRVWITHMMGFPNAQIFLSLRNVGGRQVRVNRVFIDLARHDKALCTIGVQNYLAPESSKELILMLPFNLAPGQEWAHRVNAFEALVAKEDRDLGRIRAALKASIGTKVREFRAQHPGAEINTLLEADADVLAPVMDLFRKKFMWEPGEYTLTVRIVTTQDSHNLQQAYRFTVYEADSQELRDYAKDYKYGFGAALDYEKHQGVICQLHPL